jgi:predicted phage terminase large subunit-like protein
MGALQYVDFPGYAACLVRETFQMLSAPGGLMARAQEWLGATDAVWNGTDHQYRFPSGATLTFRPLPDAGAERNFQGSEYHFIGIDEVTDLTEHQYRFLFSRLRRRRDEAIPLRMRAASNPYGPGVEWVRRRFVVEGPSQGRPYIRALLEDNPHLDQEAYEESLRQLGPLQYRQLRHGDWEARAEGGLFSGDWFTDRMIGWDDLPKGLRLCRYWDLAATEAGRGKDPDYTAGVLLGRSPDGVWYLIDVRRARRTPLQVEDLVRDTAELETAWARRRGYDRPAIRMEEEPGSAGRSVIDHYRREVLAEYDFAGVRTTGSKEARVAPVAARAEAGDLWICRRPWNTAFLDELTLFPLADHDDQVDALAGAFQHLAENSLLPAGGWGPPPEPIRGRMWGQPGQAAARANRLLFHTTSWE